MPTQGSMSPRTGRNRRLAPRPPIRTVASAARSCRRRWLVRSAARVAATSHHAATRRAESRARIQVQPNSIPGIGPVAILVGSRDGSATSGIASPTITT